MGRYRPVIVLAAACSVLLALKLLLTSIRLERTRYISRTLRSSSSVTDVAGPLLPADMTTAAEPGHSTTSKNATGWRFRVAIDGYNFGLSDEQCNLAFPKYYEEIDRAVKWRMKRNLSRITPAQLDTSWRPELIRILLYERQVSISQAYEVLILTPLPLFVIKANWADHGYDVPRAIALLQQIHRSIIGYQGVLPNVEFTISLGDWPKDPHDKWPIWVLTRHKQEFDKWVVPDFGYWSWPLGVLGDYTQFRRDVEENEVSWKDKIKKVVWRGSVKTNKLREDLVAKSQGRAWSDIHEVQWLNITTMEEKSSKRSLTMVDHCNYQFAVHTEGKASSLEKCLTY